MPSEDENCTLVEVTEEEVENSVKHIPSLATVVRRAGPLSKSKNIEPEAALERAGLGTGQMPGKQAGVGSVSASCWGLLLTHRHPLG